MLRACPIGNTGSETVVRTRIWFGLCTQLMHHPVHTIFGWGTHMKNLLLAATAVFGAVTVIAPAFADEPPPEPAKHVRHVERAAPVHVAPAARPAPAQSNPSWTGALVGGQGGVSPMAQ